MDAPLAFLLLAAKAARNGLGLGLAGERVTDLGPQLFPDLDDFQACWAVTEDAAGARAQAPIYHDIEALLWLGPDDYKQLVKQVVKEVARDESRPIRQAIAQYVAKTQASVRQALRRPDDPTGMTVPPAMKILQPTDLQPEDVMSFLPERLPIPQNGAPEPPPPPPEAEAPLVDAPVVPPVSAGEPTRITLQCTDGIHKGRTYPFTGHDTFLVGRARQAHFRLPSDDRYFSRLHFLIEVNPPYSVLLDLGSRNGTYVNGQRVQTTELHDGDVIRAGRTTLRVRGDKPLPAEAQDGEATPDTTDETFILPPPPPRPAGSANICPICAAPSVPGELLCVACLTQSRGQPQPLPWYHVVRELGQGSLGVSYLAARPASGDAVVLKTIQPAGTTTAARIQSFLRAAEMLRQLDHPHIVAYRDMGQAGALLYFVSDYVPATDAARILDKEGRVETARAVGWICQALQTLEYAHPRGFVHRGLKPANLLVETVAGVERIRLTDFGLTHVYQNTPLSGLTLQGDFQTNFAYLAPEQITNFREANPASDLYALAATLYHLLTGAIPFEAPAEPAQRLLMLLQDPPVPLQQRRPDVPEALAAIIQRGLEKDPEARFTNAHTLRQMLLPYSHC